MKSQLTDFAKTDKEKKVVKKFEALGWEFRQDDWQNSHNGDWEEDFKFKSPRMVSFANLSYCGTLTSKTIIDGEAWHLACKFIDYNESEILSKYRRLAQKRFKKAVTLKPQELKVKDL